MWNRGVRLDREKNFSITGNRSDLQHVSGWTSNFGLVELQNSSILPAPRMVKTIMFLLGICLLHATSFPNLVTLAVKVWSEASNLQNLVLLLPRDYAGYQCPQEASCPLSMLQKFMCQINISFTIVNRSHH